MNVTFRNLGWKSKISRKRSTLSISINKLVATGCGLEKGQVVYCYLANDSEERPIMITYLDSAKKNNEKKKCKRRVA